jgi:hypothetical protein
MDNASDENIRTVRDGVVRAIQQLQADQRDYGGHRATAVSDLAKAETELDRALAFDRAGSPPANASDTNVEAVIEGLNGANSQLERDQRDYGGHRVAAIADIQKAVQELREALNFDKTH